MQTRKGSYVSVRIGYILVKKRLNFTKAENENRCLTDLTDNTTF